MSESKFAENDEPINPPSEKAYLNHDDQWIKLEIDETIKEVTKHLENFHLHLATENLYEFVWHKFADSYIEKSKPRRTEAQPTLEFVFQTTLQLLHPFMPFITEELWHKTHPDKGTIMSSTWPKENKK